MLRSLFLAATVSLVLLRALPAASAVVGCPAAPDMVAPEASAGTMPRVAAALKTGRLDVLAIGSATVLGARGRAEGSFPDRMVQDLRAAAPGVEIQLTVQGERGMTATAMLSLLQKELADKSYSLVVWQTGTVEAVRRLSADEFARTLDTGADAARAAGADLVLVDPQYSRVLQDHITLEPYRETMQQVARRHSAVLFNRFELIRQWVEAGQLDLETTAKPDRPKMAERLNACLGQALAQTVLRAAGLTRS